MLNKLYLESQQRRTRTAGDKLEQPSLLLLGETPDHIPEVQDGLVLVCEAVAVFRIVLQVVNFDLMIGARDERLQFPITEHSQPVEVDNIRQSLPKSNGNQF